jgi:acyl dehydratase
MSSHDQETEPPGPCWFEDLSAGQVFTGPGRTLTETDLVMFCMITGDRHAIHADEEYAKGTKPGRRLFHGTFGIALAVAMTAELLQLRNPVISALGIRDWAFRAPLFIGDTVHSELEVVDKRVTSDGRRAVIGRRLRLINQDDVIVQEGTADLMVGLAPPPGQEKH